LEKVKRYRPYMHPEVPALSVRSVWERFMSSMISELVALQSEADAEISTFSHLARLYQQQTLCPPEFVRRVLHYYHQQFSWAKPDARLQYDDLSLFGFHSLSDWFGRDFVDLSAEFILNGAKYAEQKGYRVSIEEAKADLMRNFQVAMGRFSQEKNRPHITFKQHLSSLGFEETAAAECWRSVLLFRRYFHGVGNATFVDRMPYRDFASFALGTSVVQTYKWPVALHLKSASDFIAFQVYIQSIAKLNDPLALPSAFLPLEIIEKQTPELVVASYRMKWAESSREELGLQASFKEVRDWQLNEKNWEILRREFAFLGDVFSREERFEILEKLDSSQRLKIDAYARFQLVDQHPEWMETQISKAQQKEKIISVGKGFISIPGFDPKGPLGDLIEQASSGDELAIISLSRYSEDNKTFYRLEGVEKIADKHLLTFAEAQKEGIITQIADRYLEAQYLKLRSKTPAKFQIRDGEWKIFASVKEEVARLVFSKVLHAIGAEKESLEYAASHRLESAAKEALSCLQKNPDDSKWIAGHQDPIADQFKLQKTENQIQRTNGQEWMKEQVLLMIPKEWSPVYVPLDGDITFFYFEEKKEHEEPILQQMSYGQETIAADAQRYVATRLLEITKKKNAIVIPLQKDVQ